MIILAPLVWILVFFLWSVVFLTGLVAVSLLIPFAKVPKTLENWYLLNLPKIGWLWDNDIDGMLGDDYLAYWNNTGTHPQYPQWFDKFKYGHYLKAWYWLAIRNACNNFERRVIGCNVIGRKVSYKGAYLIRDTSGHEGWQLVWSGIYSGFYLYKKFKDKALTIRIGYKIEPQHFDVSYQQAHFANAKKAVKGFTFRIKYKPIREQGW